MFQKDFLNRIAREAIQTAEDADGRQLNLGEIVQLNIELLDVGAVLEIQGRSGTFYKFKVAYQVFMEFEKDVEEKETPDTETAKRAIRLNSEGNILAISERI
ncbi:MAG TPA: hypothetical protein ENJ82_13980 [Bacteroidetes bacterium]|nr:hypothetical protein [Bacteroidota bacterium]